MKGENLFLLILGIVAAGYVLYEGIFLILEHEKTSPAQATICEIREEGHSRWRRKYARFRYMTEQGMKESENMIQVSLGAYQGREQKVRFFLKSPRVVSVHSARHLLWGAAIAVLFISLAFLL